MTNTKHPALDVPMSLGRPSFAEVTDADIEALGREASTAGDLDMMILCTAALPSDGRVTNRARALFRDRGYRLGWHYDDDGAGAARRGWATYSAAGNCQFLGRTIRDAARKLCVRAIETERANAIR